MAVKPKHVYFNVNFNVLLNKYWAWGSVVVKSLRY